MSLGPVQPQVTALLDRASTPEQWADKGAEFFNRGQYASAQMCYERAGDVSKSTRAKVRACIRHQAEQLQRVAKMALVWHNGVAAASAPWA